MEEEDERGIYVWVGPKFKRLFLDSPCFDSFVPYDFAYCLARIPRYTGSLRCHFSVAEHSIRLAYSVAPEHRKAALWHDAIEAITNDMPSPVKAWLHGHTTAFDILESKMWDALAKRFDLPTTLSKNIKEADRDIALLEKRLLGPDVRDNVRCQWGLEAHKAESWWLQEVSRWG